MSSDPDALGAKVDHHVGIYDTDGFLISTAVAFVREALDLGAIAVVVLPPAHQQAVSHQLADAGIDVGSAVERGQLVPVDAEGYLTQLTAGGVFDRSGYQTTAEAQLHAAAQLGCELHICGNLHSLLWEAGEIATVLDLEGLWNVMPTVRRMRLLCLYSSSVFHDGNGGPERFTSLCRQHARVDPVEDYASLGDPDAPGWGVALLEQQQHAHDLARRGLAAQRRAIESELDRCLQDDRDQQDQLSRAFASRDVIGQAKGVLMVRWRVDADTAFGLLRDASGRSQRKLVDVARVVVEQQRRRN
jgi:hypothetical protein